MEPALIQSGPVTLSGLLEECENEENDDEDSGRGRVTTMPTSRAK
jgi:hypothetical protein